MSKRILVVEHDEATLEALGLAFRRAGLEPLSAPDAQQALARFREATPAAADRIFKRCCRGYACLDRADP